MGGFGRNPERRCHYSEIKLCELPEVRPEFGLARQMIDKRTSVQKSVVSLSGSPISELCAAAFLHAKIESIVAVLHIGLSAVKGTDK